LCPRNGVVPLAPPKGHLPAAVEGVRYLQTQMEPRKPRERKHRLNREAYRGEVFVMFTGCTIERRCGLLDPALLDAYVRLLGESTTAFGCNVPIYTLMPDHFHFLVRGCGTESDAYAAMLKFKLRFGIWLNGHRPEIQMQKDFYDHILRPNEGRHDQLVYIACNPVRAGFVAEPLDWPYSGAIGYELKELLR
jgi:REP element-mobilizing transposase RayT